MSRFRKLSHTIWHCQYHIIWVPKYRYRVLQGEIAEEVGAGVRGYADRMGGEVLELSVQVDHVHLQVMVPPKVSISKFVGTIKGRTAIQILNRHKKLKQKPYWGNHFWARGYCVDTIGLDEEKVRTYVRYQEKRERMAEQRGLDYR
jgi:putative transposase